MKYGLAANKDKEEPLHSRIIIKTNLVPFWQVPID